VKVFLDRKERQGHDGRQGKDVLPEFLFANFAPLAFFAIETSLSLASHLQDGFA
jgi:hypothetical protein